jgi:hypothetical protein
LLIFNDKSLTFFWNRIEIRKTIMSDAVTLTNDHDDPNSEMESLREKYAKEIQELKVNFF